MRNDEQMLQMALEAFPNFVVVNKKGEIVYLNKIYAKLLGITQEEAIGKNVEIVIPNTRMMEIIKRGQAETGSIMSLYDNDKKKEVTLICNRFPIKENDQVVGAVAMTTMDSLFEVDILNKEIERIRTENKAMKKKLIQYQNAFNPLSKVVGTSHCMLELKKAIEDYAQSNFPIIITGETGVGKEVFSSAIHQLSNRALNNYVKINCAAIPKDLLESELFGYEEGAFSGAKKGGKAGKFELANNGTILLDEIGEMPANLQTKLLRVLQEKEVERIGGLKPIKLNVRIICSTNCNLEEMVASKKFREDLYYRINVVELKIPPLRDRLDDVAGLCEHLLRKINEEQGIVVTGISQEVEELFQTYSWPGNVRELEHVLERAAYLCKTHIIELKNCKFFMDRLEKKPVLLQKEDTLKAVTHESEKAVIQEALKKSGGNKSKAAQILQINRSLLYTKIKKYNIS